MTAVHALDRNAQHAAQQQRALAHLQLLAIGLSKLELAVAAKNERGEATAADYALLDARAAETKKFARDLERGLNKFLIAHGKPPRYTPGLWR